jgi:TM2 domain-containing membrane protein YozV
MKSTAVAYLLWFFFSVLGIHRFYLGRPVSGILFLFTFGGFGLWWFLDLFLIPGMVTMENLKFGVGFGNRNMNTNVVNVHNHG